MTIWRPTVSTKHWPHDHKTIFDDAIHDLLKQTPIDDQCERLRKIYRFVFSEVKERRILVQALRGEIDGPIDMDELDSLLADPDESCLLKSYLSITRIPDMGLETLEKILRYVLPDRAAYQRYIEIDTGLRRGNGVPYVLAFQLKIFVLTVPTYCLRNVLEEIYTTLSTNHDICNKIFRQIQCYGPARSPRMITMSNLKGVLDRLSRAQLHKLLSELVVSPCRHQDGVQ